MEICDCFKRISKEEIDRVFRESESASAEMDPSFLCFEEAYKLASKLANKDTVILDFGCAYAPQSYYFTHCAKYIGVDLPFGNNVRFSPENAEFYLMSGQRFIEKVLPGIECDPYNTIAICSWCPDRKLQEMVKRFRNHIVCYGSEFDASFENFQMDSPLSEYLADGGEDELDR